MKKNRCLSGKSDLNNSIKDDPRTFDALALYFARHVEEHAKEGIKISMVMPQNEPNMAINYSSCLWTGEQLANSSATISDPPPNPGKSILEIQLAGSLRRNRFSGR